MKLHDLRPAPGSRTPKRRVGRGIAAGQGKTAGRGTKGQKARAGGTIPAWFEGGQTPLHQRLPKLHGFRNPFRIEYEVVNVGDIAKLVELGVLQPGDMPARAGAKAAKAAKGSAPVTVNQELLRAAGLVRTLDRPLKVLGGGELSSALYVLADAFSASARAKIEAAGGTASVIESELTKRRAGKDQPAADEATGGERLAATAASAGAEPASPDADAASAGAESASPDAKSATPADAEPTPTAVKAPARRRKPAAAEPTPDAAASEPATAEAAPGEPVSSEPAARESAGGDESGSSGDAA